MTENKEDDERGSKEIQQDERKQNNAFRLRMEAELEFRPDHSWEKQACHTEVIVYFPALAWDFSLLKSI